MLLAGKTALTSGAASRRGIGLATARLFAQHGARVAILDVDADGAAEAASELGPERLGIGCDVTSRESCGEAVVAARAAFGRIDSLINNAGITQPVKTLEITRPDWARVLDVNLKGGLGEAFAGLLLREGVRPAFGQIGLPDQFLGAGTLPTLHNCYGFSTDAIIASIRGSG